MIKTKEEILNTQKEYDKNKYPEEFYNSHLEILKNAKEISEPLSKAVEYLFLWKLGKIRSRQTLKSSQLEFSDSKGCRYYSIRTIETHCKIIERAIEKERLKTAISFNNGGISYDEFKPCADNLTDSSSAIVLPAFYVHIWRPAEYPILDKNVWKKFCDEKGKSVFKHTKPGSWKHFEDYTDFFKKLVADTGLDRRTVDRGLWVLGSQLKSKKGCA
ncbi:hypothetical protein KJ693_12145 [bacterium]|nr:hypothetical protein [bacterium]